MNMLNLLIYASIFLFLLVFMSGAITVILRTQSMKYEAEKQNLFEKLTENVLNIVFQRSEPDLNIFNAVKKKVKSEEIAEFVLKWLLYLDGPEKERILEIIKLFGLDIWAKESPFGRVPRLKKVISFNILSYLKDVQIDERYLYLALSEDYALSRSAAKMLAKRKEVKLLREFLLQVSLEFWSTSELLWLMQLTSKEFAFTAVEMFQQEIPEEIRATIIDYLRSMKQLDNAEIFVLQLNELKNPETITRCLKALGEICYLPAFDTILKFIASEEAYVCGAAVQALGNIGDERAIPYLLNTLGHKEWHVRYQSIISLGKIGDKGYIAVAQAAQNHKDKFAREMARFIIEKAGREVTIWHHG